MNTIFENKCTYTYHYYLQLKKKTMDKSFVNTCRVALVITLALLGLCVAKNWWSLTIAAACAVLFVLYRLFGTPIRLASFAASKNRELHGGQDVDTVNNFYEDHLLAVNVQTLNKTNIKYTEVRSLLETKDLYIIGMDKGLVLLIDKSGFSKGSREDFVEFMKEKCINAEVNI